MVPVAVIGVLVAVLIALGFWAATHPTMWGN
jgi:hypothetical protein